MNNIVSSQSTSSQHLDQANQQALHQAATHHQAGQFSEAEELYRSVLKVEPSHSDANHNLGLMAMQLGKAEQGLPYLQIAWETDPSIGQYWMTLTECLLEMGHFEDARLLLEDALKRGMESPQARQLLMRATGGHVAAAAQARKASPSSREIDELAVLFSEGKYKKAATLAQKMTEHFPLDGFGWKVLGAVFKQTGRNADALATMQKAAALSPDDAEVHNNLGATLKSLNRLDEAEASYRQALQIKPDHVEAHYNLGIILHAIGRLDEAETSYRQALQIRPDFANALNGLALLFNAQGKSMTALNAILKSLHIKETAEAKSIFVTCAKRLRVAQGDSVIRTALVRALTEPWDRPSELVRICTDLIKFNQDIGGCIVRAAETWPERLSARDLYGASGLFALYTDTLLLALLALTPICDIEMERFLTMARHAMLETCTVAGDSCSDTESHLIFYSALARQCFINEYVFFCTDDEFQQANALRDSLVAALEANHHVSALWLVTVAAYFPLYSLPFAERLLNFQWPDAVAAVLKLQIREPVEEQQLRAIIPQLTRIEGEISLLVQNQYEENPYPRWIKTAPAGETKEIDEYLSQKFPLVSFKHSGKIGNLDILIAGCGTGQQSIEAAQRFQGVQMLAVDLSMRSLGYAKRKTQELGLTSIEYAQADLLELDSLGRSFDVIESVGVLHHLADPWVGWRVLLSLLRPGGFMMLGFYSEAARRNIVKARIYIAEQGYGASANEIRRCRQDLLALDKSIDFGTTISSTDFYSVSSCRDLIFHVQEHRMTLTGIEAFLKENKLAFLGFEIEDDLLRAYKRRFPDDRAAVNLGQWQIFENENPDTFFGMYQFWVQKMV